MSALNNPGRKKPMLLVWSALCVLLNFYLLWSNVFLRYRLAESAAGQADPTSEGLKNAHSIQTVNDLYQNSGLRLENMSLRDISSHKSYKMASVLDSIGDRDIVLVCRFNQYDCEKCITYAVEKASEFAFRKDLTLFIWGWYDNDNALRALRSRYGLAARCEWYNAPEWNIPIERHGNPYFFVLTKDGTVMDLFIPDKMDPAMTDRYFGLIESKWEASNCRWY